ncbi:MAG: GAF domain-containing protein [Clostridia bacterium]|nr:GAF domain-containing protein [Clostridia bacterium]
MSDTDLGLLAETIKAISEGVTDAVANLANFSAVLFDALDRVNWAGFYRLLPDGALLLGPFQGKPACIRLEAGRGVCGAAVTRGETVVVDNVHAFPGHIACDSASRSEIVIPLRRGGQLWGVLDIDSPVEARFGDAERTALEAAAREIEAALERCE